MELQEFVEKLRDLFEDTNPEEITEETYFQELDEWSSLTALSIIAMVKTDYERNITGKQIRTCATVEDLFNFIQKLEITKE
jgi:acyl carrier protein